MTEQMINRIHEVDQQIAQNYSLLKASKDDPKYREEWRLLYILTERLIERRGSLAHLLASSFRVYEI